VRDKEFQFRRENSFSMSFRMGINIMELGVENGFKVAGSMISANKTYNIEENSRGASNMAEVLFYVNLSILASEKI
jgi:hypothetical protein